MVYVQFKILTILFLFLFGCSNIQHKNTRSLASMTNRSNISCIQIFNKFFESTSLYQQHNRGRLIRNWFKRIDSLEFNIKLLNHGVGDVDQLVRENDLLIFSLMKFLKEAGEKTEIIKKTIMFEKRKIDYHVLDLGKIDLRNSSILRIMDRMSQKFGVKKITFNFFGSMLRNSNGGFGSKSKNLRLSRLSASAFLKYDAPDFVLRHEMAHAMFEQMREKSIDSIYHFSYKSFKNELLHNGRVYQKYMTAEEMYTFSNNIYWILKSIDNVGQFARSDWRKLLTLLHDHMEALLDVSESTYSLSIRFIRDLEEMLMDNKLMYKTKWEIWGEHEVGFAIKNRRMKAFFPQVKAKYEYLFSDLIQYLKKNSLDSFVDNPDWGIENLPMQYQNIVRKKYNNLLKIQRDIFENLNKKQESLIKVSSFYKKNAKNMEVEIYELDKIFSQVENSSGEIPDGVISQLEEKFFDVKKTSREFALFSREKFKNFIGK